MNVSELYFLVVALMSPITMDEESGPVDMIAFPFPTQEVCEQVSRGRNVEDQLNEIIQEKYPNTEVLYIEGCLNYEDTLEELELAS